MVEVKNIRNKREKFLSTLFRLEPDPTYLDAAGRACRMRYALRDERWRPFAEHGWADHGVCLACGQRTVSAGRCCKCGAIPPEIGQSYAAVSRVAIVKSLSLKLGIPVYTKAGVKGWFFDPAHSRSR